MRKLLLCAMLAACSSTSAPRPAVPQQPIQQTGGLEHGMMNCPSAVQGAETKLRMTEHGVDLIVTAPDPAANVEIVKLANFHAHQDALTDWPEHSGKHGGPATIGHCPIVHDGTRITLSPTLRGIVMHVAALAPDRVRSVQIETAERLSSMPRADQR